MTRINCSDFLAEIGSLLEGEVSAEMRAHLVQHLAECKACEVIYDSTRKCITILTDSQSFELPAEQLNSTTRNIMDRIRAIGTPPPGGVGR